LNVQCRLEFARYQYSYQIIIQPYQIPITSNKISTSCSAL